MNLLVEVIHKTTCWQFTIVVILRKAIFPGSIKKFDGMDWRSIRLVFKIKDGKYFLVGVIHDEWTI
ncbi:MAG: hypothetical protein IPL04_13125 [Chitinophagaceae bacterium]|nr:hypothetical protein [Chitinophagaceae bacterium]